MRWTLTRFTLFLAAALTVWLWPSIFGGKVLLPLDILATDPFLEADHDASIHNALIADVLVENYAWKRFQRSALAAGELPLWNPHTFCGHPLYATGQASTFYPFNLIFMIVPLPYAYVVFIWLHLLLGGVFTFLFIRRVGVGGFGASVGGVIFAMSGFFAVRFIWPMLLGSAIWLPLMLLWIDATARPRAIRDKLRGVGLGALLFAQPILAGFFEIAFYAFVACGMYTVYHAIRLKKRSCGVFLVKVASVTLLAVLIASPQLLPFFEVMGRNIRAGQGDYAQATAAALEGRELINLVVPDAWGNPARHEGFNLTERAYEPIRTRDRADFQFFGDVSVGKNYVSLGCYFGVLSVLWAAMSFGVGDRECWFFRVLFAVAILFALGTPVYRIFYHLVPGAEQVRTPYRWMYLATFAGCYLAAVGAQRWFNRFESAATSATRIASLAGVGLAMLGVVAVVVLLYVPGPLERWAERFLADNPRARSTFNAPAELAGLQWINAARLSGLLLIATVCTGLAYARRWSVRGRFVCSLSAMTLLAFDLGQATYGFNTHGDPAVLDRTPTILQDIQAEPGPFRIARYGPRDVLPPNLPTLYGLQDVGGYDSIVLSDYAAFIGAIEYPKLLPYNKVTGFERKASLDSPLLPLLNIRYLLATRSLKHPDWRRVGREGKALVYRVRREKELPRAFFVEKVESVASLDDALQRLKSGEIDVTETAIVETTPETAAALVDPPNNDPIQRAIVTKYGNSSVQIETDATRRSLLVLCDAFYSGWRAYVDGNRADVLCTNGIFRGVSVPAGRHVVVFRFQPPSFRIGVALCAVVLATLAVVAVARCVRRREGSASPDPT